MNSVYIKFYVKKLRNILNFHSKTSLVGYIHSTVPGTSKSETEAKVKTLKIGQSGPQILTTKEVNESALLDSPLSENSIENEKVFSNEEEIIVEQNIRKFVLETSKKIFKEWFIEKTIKSKETPVRERSPPLFKRRRGRRLKRIDDL